MTSLVEKLAEMKRISSEYTDAWGKPAFVSLESKAAMLAAMGYDIENEENLQKQIDSEEEKYWNSCLDPVLVVKVGYDIVLETRLLKSNAESKLSYIIKTEQGGKLEGDIEAKNFTAQEEKSINGVDYVKKPLKISSDLPLGYHELTLKLNSKKLGSLRLIIVPLKCYKPQSIIDGLKIWGPSVQLYTLRSEKNWGVGDFTDLTNLIKNLADWGAGFIGLNPIHALYPANPESASPYSPSSRRWINVVYIDVEAIDEFKKCDAVVAEVNSPEFQARLSDLRAKEYVDYTGVMTTKIDILKKVYSQVQLHKDKKSTRGKAFQKFIEEGGESLNQIAVYDALQASLYAEGQNAWGWPAWEDKYKKYSNPEVKKWADEHETEVNFYKYLQFIADEQLAKADLMAKDKGMDVGIYRDLAVGVSEGSAELWANADIYCPKASVGAPPDVLGPLGQNWGLPPMDPNKLFEAKYQPIIDLFRSNMKSCGSLRIDHAMSLLRLWWVPPREPASKGAYIYYNVNDMIGILALESVRNKSLIIGEDLGTVPDIMKKLLPESGIYSYKIFFFETSKTDGGYISTKDYAVQAMSALTTHDMATLRGFWHCDDLKLGRKLGLYQTDEIMNNLMKDRLESKQKILNSLDYHRVLGPSINRNALYCGMTTELNHAMQIHMCNGSSSLFSTQLEDWLEMDKPVNIPGTSSEYPNWRRKLSKNINEIFANPKLKELAAKMTEARQKASQRS